MQLWTTIYMLNILNGSMSKQLGSVHLQRTSHWIAHSSYKMSISFKFSIPSGLFFPIFCIIVCIINWPDAFDYTHGWSNRTLVCICVGIFQILQKKKRNERRLKMRKKYLNENESDVSIDRWNRCGPFLHIEDEWKMKFLLPFTFRMVFSMLLLLFFFICSTFKHAPLCATWLNAFKLESKPKGPNKTKR